MKMMIDNTAGVVTDDVALKMVAQIVDSDDGTVNFTGGLAVEIKTGKSQKTFKVAKRVTE